MENALSKNYLHNFVADNLLNELMHLQMDLFELEAVELTGINRVITGHDAYKPGDISFYLE